MNNYKYLLVLLACLSSGCAEYYYHDHEPDIVYSPVPPRYGYSSYQNYWRFNGGYGYRRPSRIYRHDHHHYYGNRPSWQRRYYGPSQQHHAKPNNNRRHSRRPSHSRLKNQNDQRPQKITKPSFRNQNNLLRPSQLHRQQQRPSRNTRSSPSPLMGRQPNRVIKPREQARLRPSAPQVNRHQQPSRMPGSFRSPTRNTKSIPSPKAPARGGQNQNDRRALRRIQ